MLNIERVDGVIDSYDAEKADIRDKGTSLFILDENGEGIAAYAVGQWVCVWWED